MPPIAWNGFYGHLLAIMLFIQMSFAFTLALMTGEVQPSPPPPPPKKRKHSVWIRPWLQQRDEKGAYTNHMSDLYTLDNSAFTNYTRLTPEFFDFLNARLEPCLTKRNINFRCALPPGLKLTITLRHLATGETYQSLAYQLNLGLSAICKILSKFCKAI